MEIAGLYVYPVKSLGGIEVQSSTLGVKGLSFDRNWIIADTDGNFVTQRQLPLMATIGVSLSEQCLTLKRRDGQSLDIPLSYKQKSQAEVTVWRDRVLAFDEGDHASKWLTAALASEQPLRLYRFPETEIRKVSEEYLNGHTSHTAFADGYPFLVCSEASLALLNDKLKSKREEAVTMDRFRPNLVIRGFEAFQEDRISLLESASGRFSFMLCKPCQRCSITTVDQLTGEITNPKEPLRTLAGMNPFPDLRGAFFGQNAILTNGDGHSIRVGDKLTILDRSAQK